MADHVRKQIRVAAAAAVTGLVTAGARVFASRTYELQGKDLPGLRIYTNDEEIEKLQGDPGGEQGRELDLIIECCSKKSAALDDELDLMAQEVEVAIAGNQGIGGAQYVDLVRIETEMQGEGEKEIGVLKMTFLAWYVVDMAAPDVAI